MKLESRLAVVCNRIRSKDVFCRHTTFSIPCSTRTTGMSQLEIVLESLYGNRWSVSAKKHIFSRCHSLVILILWCIGLHFQRNFCNFLLFHFSSFAYVCLATVGCNPTLLALTLCVTLEMQDLTSLKIFVICFVIVLCS